MKEGISDIIWLNMLGVKNKSLRTAVESLIVHSALIVADKMLDKNLQMQ